MRTFLASLLVTGTHALSTPSGAVYVGYTFFKGNKKCEGVLTSQPGSREHLDGAWVAKPATSGDGYCFKRAYTGFAGKSQKFRWEESTGKLYMKFYDDSTCSGVAKTTITQTSHAPQFPSSMVASTDFHQGCMLSPDDPLSSYKLAWSKGSTSWSPASGQSSAQNMASGSFAETWSLAVFASTRGTTNGYSTGCETQNIVSVEEQFPRCGKCVSFGNADYRQATCSPGKVISTRFNVAGCTGTGTVLGTWEKNKCYSVDSNGYSAGVGSSTGASYQLMDCGAPFGGNACQEGTTPLSAAAAAAFLACCICLIITPIILCICCGISIGVAICIGCACTKKNSGGNNGIVLQQRKEPEFAPQQAQVIQAQVVQAQPVMVQAQPQVVQAQPVMVQAQPQVVQAQVM